MKLKHLVFSLLVIFVLYSCRTSRQVTQTKTSLVQKKESTVSYKDTTLVTQATITKITIPKEVIKQDLNKVEVLFNQDLKKEELTNNTPLTIPKNKQPKKPPKYTSKNGNAKASVRFDNNNMYVDCECDTIAIAAKIKSTYVKERSDSVHEKTEKKKVKRGVSIFNCILYCFVFLVIGLIAGYFTNKLKLL